MQWFDAQGHEERQGCAPIYDEVDSRLISVDWRYLYQSERRRGEEHTSSFDGWYFTRVPRNVSRGLVRAVL